MKISKAELLRRKVWNNAQMHYIKTKDIYDHTRSVQYANEVLLNFDRKFPDKYK